MNQNNVTGIGDEAMLENIRRAEECHFAAKARESIDDATQEEWDAARRELMSRDKEVAMQKVMAAEREFASRAAMEKASPTTDVTAVLEERGKRYGKFKDHARISQEMKRVMQKTDGWHNLGATGREALEMIAHKIARILNGDPNYADSWVDIAGYAKLVADRLEGTER